MGKHGLFAGGGVGACAAPAQRECFWLWRRSGGVRVCSLTLGAFSLLPPQAGAAGGTDAAGALGAGFTAEDAAAAREEALVPEGGLVVIYESFTQMRAARAVRGATFNNRYGTFDLGALVGKAYGRKVYASRGKGFVHVLRPTSELWTKVRETLAKRASMRLSLFAFRL